MYIYMYMKSTVHVHIKGIVRVRIDIYIHTAAGCVQNTFIFTHMRSPSYRYNLKAYTPVCLGKGTC